MKRFIVLAFSILIALVVTSCAKPPDASIEQARSALQSAELTGSQQFAPGAWNHAKQTVDDLNAELAVQNERFILFRNYKRVETLAEEATAAANQAREEADRNKAQLRAEVTKMIADLKSSLQSGRTQLSRLPSTAAVNTANLRSRLEAAGRTLDQAQAELNGGQLDTAMASAGAARDNIMAVLRTIEQAAGRPPAKKR